MKGLFNQFLREKEFLAGLSKKTLSSYQQAFNAYQRVLSRAAAPSNCASATNNTIEELPTKDTLKDFVIGN